MKATSKHLEQHCDAELKTSLTLSFGLCLRALRSSSLIFCFLASICCAKTVTEQLDPIELLMLHSTKTSQDANAPDIKDAPPATKTVSQPPMQIVQLPPDRQQQAHADPIEIAPVNFAAQIEEKSPQGNFIFASSPANLLARQLWQERITVAKDEKSQRSKNELRRIIEQIRSVEFEPQRETLEPAVVTELVSAAKPDETLPGIKSPNESQEKEIESENQGQFAGLSKAQKGAQSAEPLPYQTVTDQTLQMLENISQHPEKLDNPFELAEVLFLSGHLDQALVCYREALKRSSPDNAQSAQERAWILFQIANCLRNVDRPMAMKTYRQLIAEYPDSPWTDLAKAQDKLVDWFDKDKPVALMTESEF
ncbi:MAG: tetratricopeptide repeat protein [Planctomycetota bacterium]|jgi:hypothetical protein